MICIYFYSKYATHEGFVIGTPRCPDMLIQKGSRFYLYNSKLTHVPGVNPIEFESLEDYTEFLEWQKSQGIRCPVLYLQSSYDAQGNSSYKVRPSVTNPQAGLSPSQPFLRPSAAAPVGIASSSPPILETSLITDSERMVPQQTLLVDATHDDAPYNWNGYPAYDPSTYYVGTNTPLDDMNTKQQAAKVSPNPMDPNWGGNSYTQSLIDKGYYKENNVSLYVDQ